MSNPDYHRRKIYEHMEYLSDHPEEFVKTIENLPALTERKINGHFEFFETDSRTTQDWVQQTYDLEFQLLELRNKYDELKLEKSKLLDALEKIHASIEI